METTEEKAEAKTKNNTEKVKNDYLEFFIEKIDSYLAEQNLQASNKRKFKETSEIFGTVYKFSHFGIEVIKDQVTIFGKYNSEFFDIEAYESADKLLEELLPRILEFYQNPVLTKHPIIRYFSKFKK